MQAAACKKFQQSQLVQVIKTTEQYKICSGHSINQHTENDYLCSVFIHGLAIVEFHLSAFS